MIRRLTVAAFCACALALLVPMAAAAAHPLRYTIDVFEPVPNRPETLEGPCGAVVGPGGELFVSDYYRDKVVIFDSAGEYSRQISGINPIDAPCGLAVDAAGVIYANLYHGGIAVLEPSAGGYANRGEVLSTYATGVAIDPASGNLLVDERTHVAEYALPLAAGAAPLRTIGTGSLEDGYGLAVSGFAGTAGRVYVADAAAGTVKAFDPASSLTTPVAELDGAGTALGRFNDLTDAALATDDADGHLYVADDLSGRLYERPQAGVQEFDPAGSFSGQLEPKSVDGEPVGLAVDNTGGGTQSDVYVTSGNSEGSVVLAFGPSPPPAPAPFAAAAGAPAAAASAEGGSATPPTGPAAAGGTRAPASASPPTGRKAVATPRAVSGGSASRSSSTARRAKVATASTITQKGTLRVQVKGGMNPKKLPRKGSAPVSVSVAGHVTTSDGSAPPRLRVLTIDINRHGDFDLTGLPVCKLSSIQPASTSRALAACRSSLVGQGHFWGETSLSGEPYETQGRLLLFNGRRGGRPVIFGQIYSTKPFTSSYVVPFSVRTLSHGTYGTELRANLAASLGHRESLTGIEMVLSRRYTYEGKHRSVISAGCPAPNGFHSVNFSLLRASFTFDGPSVSSTLSGNCRAR